MACHSYMKEGRSNGWVQGIFLQNLRKVLKHFGTLRSNDLLSERSFMYSRASLTPTSAECRETWVNWVCARAGPNSDCQKRKISFASNDCNYTRRWTDVDVKLQPIVPAFELQTEPAFPLLSSSPLLSSFMAAMIWGLVWTSSPPARGSETRKWACVN